MAFRTLRSNKNEKIEKTVEFPRIKKKQQRKREAREESEEEEEESGGGGGE